MPYINNFKRALGGKMYCYGLIAPTRISSNQFDGNIVTYIDTELYPKVFGRIDWDLSAVAVCIEPMNAEQRKQAWQGERVDRVPGGFQDNTVCLLFNDVESIDNVIDGLQFCKKRIKEKIKKREQEEYRKKYCGQVVKFADILALRNSAAI